MRQIGSASSQSQETADPVSRASYVRAHGPLPEHRDDGRAERGLPMQDRGLALLF